MKYKLINSVTKKETICDKVTIDGFDYYVSDEKINSSNYEDFNFWFYNPYIKELQISSNPNSCHKVIATNNPNIVNCCNGKKGYKTVKGFIYGYK